MPLTPPLLPNSFFAIEATPPQGSLFLFFAGSGGTPIRPQGKPPAAASAQPERPAGGSPPVQTRHTKKAVPAESLFLLLFAVKLGELQTLVALQRPLDIPLACKEQQVVAL